MFPGVPKHSFVVRFRPTGPWRFGPDTGARDRVDFVYHSDAVFSAVTAGMARLGRVEEWLDATARAEDAPAVRFSSFFPFQGDHLFVPPPRHLWPPLDSAKVRYKGARFVPVSLVEALVAGAEINEDRWSVDGESECLMPAEKNSHHGPFRVTLRSNAAVDRLTPGNVELHSTACLEYSRGAGLWTLAVFASDEARARWEEPVRSAFRLLADSGFGGERSRGWGRSEMPEWQECARSEETTPAAEPTENGYWLLSLYTPAHGDSIDWRRGSYSTITRTGRIESPARWGESKSASLMIAEGSVLLSGNEPRGSARDLAPEGFPHPVFRAGFAVAFPVPWRTPA
jgi:CRISPR type III-A-associated RAMP protein Csm4